MTLDEIKDVIKLMSENDLTEFQIENNGFTLCLKREATAAVPVQTAIPPATASQPAIDPEVMDEKAETNTINSPLVGTFYSAPGPSAPPYVKVGDEVTPDTTVGVIEAMKMMNEIKAEKAGVIQEILVKNASPVEYGQKLFVIK